MPSGKTSFVQSVCKTDLELVIQRSPSHMTEPFPQHVYDTAIATLRADNSALREERKRLVDEAECMQDSIVELQMKTAQLEIEKGQMRKRARLAEGKLEGMLMTIKHLTFANRDLTSENKELTQQCNSWTFKAMDERDAAHMQNNTRNSTILLNSRMGPPPGRSTTPMGPPPGTPPASAIAHRTIPRTPHHPGPPDVLPLIIPGASHHPG